MKILIAAASLCVIGWTVYYGGGAAWSYFEYRQHLAHVQKIWAECMRFGTHSVLSTHEENVAYCTAKGHINPLDVVLERIHDQRK